MKVFIFDLESDGLLEEATKVWCGVFKELGKDNVKEFRPHQIKEMLEFMDTVDVLGGHNIIGFDLPLLKKLYEYEFKGKKFDTLLMSRILNPKRLVPPHCPNKMAPHGVEAWGYRVGRGKPEHNDWANFSEEMLHRCSEDTHIQELIYQALLKEAAGGNWKHAFQMSFKLFEFLQEQADYGWKFDSEYAKKSITKLEKLIAFIDKAVTPKLPQVLEVDEQKLKGEYGYIKKPFLKSGEYSKSVKDWADSHDINLDDRPVLGCFSRVHYRIVNLNSNEETKDYLLSVGWEPVEWNYNDEGERSSPKMSKDDPFEGVEGVVGRYVARRVQCRQRKSIIEGLIGCVREDGRIPSAVANMAVTGRLTHRNIVNIPNANAFWGKQMRKMFTCSPGNVLVSTDSAGNQIRMLCGRMNDPVYTDIVLNGDVHEANRIAAGLPTRGNAKTFFYGFLFGAGDAKTGKIVKGTAEHGRKLKEQFLAGLPKLAELLNNLQQEWRKTAKKRTVMRFGRLQVEYYDGVISGLDGRPILIPSEHQILVYMLQSDEAIMMTAAYNKANMELRKRFKYGEDFGCVCFYHDEFTFECREEIAEEVKKISEQAIAWAGRYFKISCPHEGQGKIGRNWYEVH